MPILDYTYRTGDQVFTLEKEDAIYVKDSNGKLVVGGYNHSRAWTAMREAASDNDN
jgi:hypothetical protein